MNLIQIINNTLIINGNDLYIRKTNIGKFGICEIPNEELEIYVKNCILDIYIHINFSSTYKQILHLQNKKSFIIESEGKKYKVWFCKILYNDDNNYEQIKTVNIIYGRCESSMIFLDKLYRDYVQKYKFKIGDVIGIKSVAGSGKTTTLLNLAKTHKDKKILYIAFNKSLIIEIKDKIRKECITNLYPQTFDALARMVYLYRNKISSDDFGLFELKPQNLGTVIPWFSNKPYKIKNYFVKNYVNFCNQSKYNNMNDYCKNVLGGEKKMLNTMWAKSLDGDLVTFDTVRKMAEINHYCRDYLDSIYDMIFIDESQDFDSVMLKILLEDTTIPKLFVGDPKQAIYEWKGCINAFDKLPKESLIIEFYSTFRVGNPACSEISAKFMNCHMISKSMNNTVLQYNVVPLEHEKYVYLFRSWRNLLQNAQYLNKIWINNFDAQITYMKRLHERLKISNLDEDELGEFSDDLPKFLLKLSAEELDKLINDIQKNVVVHDECLIEIYTIHTYKGLESNIVRIYNDIQLPKEENLYYVALTRGKERIILDTVKDNCILYEDKNGNKKQKKMTHYGAGAIIL